MAELGIKPWWSHPKSCLLLTMLYVHIPNRLDFLSQARLRDVQLRTVHIWKEHISTEKACTYPEKHGPAGI